MLSESITHTTKSAEKPQPSQAELRTILEQKLKLMKAPLQEGAKEYKQALKEGLFDDQENEPDGSGEARKTAMQKKLTFMVDRAEKLKARIDSKEPLSRYTQEIQADYTYTNPETNNVELQETITLDIEQKLQEHLSFYKTTNIDLPPDFEVAILDIWERNQDEIQEAIKEHGFNEILIIPGNTLLPDLKDKMSMENGYFEGDNFKQGGSFAKAKSQNTDKPRIVLVHNAQNIKDRPELAKTLNIQGKDVNPDQSLDLEDYLIFQRKYFEETGKHLDEIGWTWLVTKSGTRLVDAYWAPDDHELIVGASGLDYRHGYLGVRSSRCFF